MSIAYGTASGLVCKPRDIMVDVGNGPSSAGALAGIYVLFVDDNFDAREIIKHFLEQHGAFVRLATSARGALEVLGRTSPDIVITDLSMPKLDGVWLLKQIRESPRAPILPVIALTAYAGAFTEDAILAKGFTAYLTKPITPKTLVQTVARFVGR